MIPQIAEDMDIGLESAQWVLTVTLLCGAVATPLLGRLGDGPHRKRVMLGTIAFLTVGACIGAVDAEVSSLAVLLGGRGMMGGGFALLPLTMAAARETLPRANTARVIGILSVTVVTGVGVGYPLTGLIADVGGVSTALWFGAAVGLVGFVVASLVVPHPAATANARRVDWLGAVTAGVGLVLLLLALAEGATWGWSSPETIWSFVGGIVVLGLWSLWELRVSHPLVDLRLMRHRALLTANIVGILLAATMFISVVTMTQFILSPAGFAQSMFVAGLTLVPLSVASGGISRLLPWVERQLEIRKIITFGAVLIAAAVILFSLTMGHFWLIVVAMGIIGIGLGCTFAALPGLIVGTVPLEETGSAMSLYQVSRYIGAALGTVVAATSLLGFGRLSDPTQGSYRWTALDGAGRRGDLFGRSSRRVGAVAAGRCRSSGFLCAISGRRG